MREEHNAGDTNTCSVCSWEWKWTNGRQEGPVLPLCPCACRLNLNPWRTAEEAVVLQHVLGLPRQAGLVQPLLKDLGGDAALAANLGEAGRQAGRCKVHDGSHGGTRRGVLAPSVCLELYITLLYRRKSSRPG